jgi:hypothetical protein
MYQIELDCIEVPEGGENQIILEGEHMDDLWDEVDLRKYCGARLKDMDSGQVLMISWIISNSSLPTNAFEIEKI